MAKGDRQRATQDQATLDKRLGLDTSNYQDSLTRNLSSYDDIMNSYKNYFGGDRSGSNYLTSAGEGYGKFAADGGINVENIRARAISPIRAVYANAQRNVDRQRTLQGGYSPNYTAAMTKMAREQGANVADANTNVEAAIAELISRNKLAGLSGMTGVGESMSNQDLNALSGMTSLYGTSPGLTRTLGDQILQAEAIRRGIYNMPSTGEQVMNNVGRGIGYASQGAQAANAFGKFGGAAGAGAGASAGLVSGTGAAGSLVPGATTLGGISGTGAGATSIGAGFSAGVPIADIAATGAGTSIGTGVGTAAGTGTSAGMMAGLGTSAGASLAMGGIMGGVAAAIIIAADAYARNRNDTRIGREKFAKQLGLPNIDALYNQLGSMGPEGEALRIEGMRMGKKDYTNNFNWFQKVAKLLQRPDLISNINNPCTGPQIFTPQDRKTVGL